MEAWIQRLPIACSQDGGVDVEVTHSVQSGWRCGCRGYPQRAVRMEAWIQRLPIACSQDGGVDVEVTHSVQSGWRRGYRGYP